MEYVLMGRSQISYTGYSGWGKWIEIERFKSEQAAKLAMQDQINNGSRNTWEYRIEAR